ncbi:MAG: GDP-mannose 4,6-dehydratase [Patescibacteria group bacterium]
MKKAFVTGVTGQDGSYLAEFLISKGYEVHGIMRRSSSFNTKRISHIPHRLHDSDSRLHLHYGDLADGSSLARLLQKIQPDEIYNLGAQSHVRVSFDIPEYTTDITALGTLRLLEAIRESGLKTKFYQASSSEMFGLAKQSPQNENTPFHPRSPYACAKAFSYWIAKNYREAYGLFIVNGILFNHESPRRGESFVSKKITNGVARIKAGLDKKLYLGNLDAIRDWGYAPEYVEAMWLMLQQPEPDDYVVATGESHTVREFVEESFKLAGMDWKQCVEIDPRYHRPSETPELRGDYSKAKNKLGWEPKVKFKSLIKIMLEHDFKEHGLVL